MISNQLEQAKRWLQKAVTLKPDWVLKSEKISFQPVQEDKQRHGDEV
jgi:hypothetical protein